MFITPQPPPPDEREIDPRTWGSQKILEDSIKQPPKHYHEHGNGREWYENYIQSDNMIVKKQRVSSMMESSE
jgi:hypothetical protein